MFRHLKRTIALLLAVCLLAGLVAGCGNGASESSAAGEETGGESLAADGELVIGMASAWETLTPFRNMTAYGILYARMLYDSLGYRMEDGSVIPVVAKSWTVREDGVTWDIEIYDYVTDSAGNAITAADIVWVLEEQKARGLKPIFNRIDTVEQTGDYTLAVKFTADIAGTIESILQHTYVVSKAAFEASEDEFATDVVSTSPYKVVDFVSGASLTLEKRENYWQKPELIDPTMANNLDRVVFRYIPEASQQQIALETDEVDIFASIDGSLVPAFEGNDKFVVAPANYNVGSQIFFSGYEGSPVANDVNLRKAIAYAIDEQGIIDGVYSGLAGRAYDCAPDSLLGYQEDWKQEDYYSYDPEKAKEYLAQSDYDGQELVIMASSSTRNTRLLTMIQAYLLEVGINVKMNLVDRALYSASMNDGSAYDMIQVSAGGADFPSFWANRFDSTSFPNGDATGRKDETLTRMIQEASTTEGFTAANINAIHDYVNENLYGYNICQPMVADVYNSAIGMTQASAFYAGGIDYIASTYE